MDAQDNALFAAIEANDLDEVKRALASGANVNAAIGGSTALHNAVMQKNLEIIKLLCAEGADVGLRDDDKQTVFGYCAGSLSNPTTRFLAEVWVGKYGPKAALTIRLFDAIKEGSQGAISTLHAEGVDLNDGAWRRNTPLQYAVTHGAIETVRHMLDLGADPNRADVLGSTALHTACRGADNGELKALLLIERGASVSAQGNLQLTPLHLAAEAGYIKAVTTLLDAGADPNATTRAGNTPLKCAKKKAEVAALLQARGAR